MSDHPLHPHAHASHRWAIGLTAGLGGFIAAPYLISALGSKAQVGKIMAALHGDGLGTGLAGSINGVVSHIPVIGHALVTNVYASFAATAGLAIGGMLLAHYLEKREKDLPPGSIHWSKVVRYSSLITSALIALPSILTGISVSIAFFAACAGGAVLASQVISKLSTTIGTAGVATGSNLFAAALPHLFTCGAAILPLGLSSLFTKKEPPSEQPHTLAMQLVSTDSPVKDQPCELAFHLIDTTTGRTLGPKDLATYHTKKLHTMIVDASLSDYHHLHPQYDEKRGLFTCSFTPQLSQPYRAWHDFIPAGTDKNVHLTNDLPAAHAYAMRPMIVPSQQATAADVRIDIAPADLRAGSAGMLSIEVRDSKGNPLTDLEPIMGSYAHLVGFSEDGNHLIHCHPTGHQPKAETDRGTGNLQFHITPETAGNTKFFLQIRRHGEDITIPFGQRIQPPAKYAERVTSQLSFPSPTPQLR